MGMDYVGRNFSPQPQEFVPISFKEEKAEVGKPILRYQRTFHLNWTGHGVIGHLLSDLGADMSQWSGSNDGDFIDDATCKTWASLLKKVIDEGRIGLGPVSWWPEKRRLVPRITGLTTVPVPPEDKEWILGFAEFLEECGGCEQW